MVKLKKENSDNFILPRFRKLGDQYLITSDGGHWTFSKTPKINNINNNDPACTQYQRKYKHLFQGTALHIIVLTLRCNLKCSYCHASVLPTEKQGKDIDEVTLKKTIDFIFQSPADKITIEFQGGEPLLRFDLIKKAIDYALSKKGKEVRFALVTNLLLMDDEKLDYLISKKVGICTSLDGPKEVHDQNRGCYDLLTKKIDLVKNKTQLNALMVTTKHSLGKHKEIIDEYVLFGLDKIQIKPLNQLGFAKGRQDLSITSEEFIDFWQKSIKYIMELNSKGVNIKETMTEVILNKIKGFVSDEIYLDLLSPCGAAIGQLAYNYNGNIYSCDEARMLNDDLFLLGNVNKNNYKEILTSDKCCALIASSINDTHFCDLCAYKPYCGLCPVCSYADTNNVIPHLPDFRCTVHKAMFDFIFKNFSSLNDSHDSHGGHD
jgi:uncharacterized protein